MHYSEEENNYIMNIKYFPRLPSIKKLDIVAIIYYNIIIKIQCWSLIYYTTMIEIKNI